jgi:hypothetical protein
MRGGLATGHDETVPDIAVEVVLPNDSLCQWDESRIDYNPRYSAGLVVNPKMRVITLNSRAQFRAVGSRT